MDEIGQLGLSAIYIIMKGGNNMPSYSKQIKGSLTEEQYKELMKFVKNNETTVSQVVRIALKEYLEKHKED